MTSAVDHCTGWFEGTWAHCCAAHDLAYGGLASSKLSADLELAVCVAAVGGWPVAIVMGGGVLLFGLPFWIRARLKSPPRR